MKYAFLNALRDRTTLFWMFAFPIFLMTILISALPDGGEDLVMHVGMSPEHPAAPYIESDEHFEITKLDDYEAELKDGTIDGYIDRDGRAYFVDTDFKQKAVKTFADTLVRMEKDPEATRKVLAGNFVKTHSEEVSYKGSFFFALVAMLSYMAAYSGVNAVESMQANIKPDAVRFLVSPAGKFKATFYGFIVSMLLQLANLTLVILYAKFVLGESFVEHLFGTYVVFFIASAFSYTLGLMTVYLGAISSNARGAIVQTSMMLLSGGAGLFGTFFRTAIGRELGPAANYNPVKIITDAVYKMNILGDRTHLYKELVGLVIASVVFLLLATLKMRKNRYDSI